VKTRAAVPVCSAREPMAMDKLNMQPMSRRDACRGSKGVSASSGSPFEWKGGTKWRGSASGASGSSREKGGRWGPMCTRTLPAGKLRARREAEQRSRVRQSRVMPAPRGWGGGEFHIIGGCGSGEDGAARRGGGLVARRKAGGARAKWVQVRKGMRQLDVEGECAGCEASRGTTGVFCSRCPREGEGDVAQE
jgi:hypothetical protein